MSLQLSIVAALLLGVFVYDYNFMQSEQSLSFEILDRDVLEKVFILAGILLVVQGFETSRFLGEKYHAEVRVRTMRWAQLIGGALFVVSVIALMPIVQHLNLEHIQVAEIVAATGLVATALPLMLIVAAIMSQFSAAVADTVGAGSLASESSRGKLKTNMGYLVVCFCAVLSVAVFRRNIGEPPSSRTQGSPPAQRSLCYSGRHSGICRRFRHTCRINAGPRGWP
jgi:MFS family permease